MYISWLVGSISDWTELFRQAYRCLKPGGYIESFEAEAFITSDDGTVVEKSAQDQWGKLFIELGKRTGRLFTVVQDGTQRKSMEEVGFVDVEERDFKVKCNPTVSPFPGSAVIRCLKLC